MSADDTFSATEVFSSVDIAGGSRVELRTGEDGAIELMICEPSLEGTAETHVFRATLKGAADASALATALLEWAAATKTKTEPKSKPPATERGTP